MLQAVTIIWLNSCGTDHLVMAAIIDHVPYVAIHLIVSLTSTMFSTRCYSNHTEHIEEEQWQNRTYGQNSVLEPNSEADGCHC